MIRRALLTLAIAATLAGTQTNTPRAILEPDGNIDVMLPPTVLRNDEVKKHLHSGLTTAFVATMEEREIGGRKLRGALRVEVRYELWDEIYLVSTLDAYGRRQQLNFPTYERLVEWWSRTAIRFAQASSANQAPESMRIKLDVLPFSAQEEADAQRWLAESVGKASSPADAPGIRGGTSGSVLDLIIGTSVKRRSLLAFRWTVPIPREGR